MKRYLSLIVAVLFIFIAFFSFYQISKQKNAKKITVKKNISAPKIEITPQTYDLGTVIYGDITRRTFMIKNTGNAVLKIKRVSTSCGCTKATIKDVDRTIVPGEQVPLEVSFDPAVHKDVTDLGELTRIIYVGSNDPNTQEVEVTITANVIKKD